MKRIALYLSLALVGASAAMWYFNPKIEAGEAPTLFLSDSQPVAKNIYVDSAASSELKPPSEDFGEPEVVGLVVTSKPKSSSEDSDAPESRFNEDWMKGKDCYDYYFVNEDGIADSVVECTLKKRERHPYYSYSTEALTDLAYGDTKAAEILGSRLIWQATDKKVATEEAQLKMLGVIYYLRAAALSGDISFIYKGAGSAYSLVADVNGVKTGNIVNYFILEQVAYRLSGERRANREWPSPWQRKFNELNLSADKTQEVNARIEHLARGTANLQTQVTGNTEFAEAMGDG